MMYIVVKLPYLRSSMLKSTLSKGMGHNYYGEPALPNDILYIFPIVIYGSLAVTIGLAIGEPIYLSSGRASKSIRYTFRDLTRVVLLPNIQPTSNTP